MRVAFATTDDLAVDAHFGSTPRLLVFEVTAAGAQPAARVELGAAEEDGGHDKLEPRLSAVSDCAIVYAAAVGPTASARLRALGIRAVAAPPGEPVAALVERLVTLLAGTPPPWLRRLVDGRRPGDLLEGATP